MKIRYKALDTHVLVVAKEGRIKDWAAYIGAVLGMNHDIEFMEVAGHGSKIPYWMAKKMFPDFDEEFTWRE